MAKDFSPEWNSIYQIMSDTRPRTSSLRLRQAILVQPKDNCRSDPYYSLDRCWNIRIDLCLRYIQYGLHWSTSPLLGHSADLCHFRQPSTNLVPDPINTPVSRRTSA